MANPADPAPNFFNRSGPNRPVLNRSSSRLLQPIWPKLSLLAQHSSSSTWGSCWVSNWLFIASPSLVCASRPVRFCAPRPSWSACLLIRPFLAPLLSRCWCLFRYPFVHLTFKWFGVSKSNCSTEWAFFYPFTLLSELAVSNSTSFFSPLSTSHHVRVLTFLPFLGLPPPCVVFYGSSVWLLPSYPASVKLEEPSLNKKIII